MTRSRYRILFLGLASCVASVMFVAPAERPASAQTYTSYQYGTTPYSDVMGNAAQCGDSYNCRGKPSLVTCGLSKAQLVAAVLSPTYGEAGRHNNDGTSDLSFAPAPGAMGRSDFDTNEYARANGTSGSRLSNVFWYTGIGLWENDDKYTGNAGLNTDVFFRFGDGYAGAMATITAKRWCTINHNRTTTTPAFVGANIYNIWNSVESSAQPQFGGCSLSGSATRTNDRCVSNFNQILSGTESGTAMYSGGGLELQKCQMYNIPNSTPFTCIYIDPSEGGLYINNCDITCVPPTAVNGLNPLSAPFYAFHTKANNGDDLEWRYWTAECTGLNYDYFAYRRTQKAVDGYLQITPVTGKFTRYATNDTGQRSGYCRHYG